MKVFLFGGSEELGEYVLKQLAERGHETVTVAENTNRAEELKMFGAAHVMLADDEDFTKAIADAEAIIYIGAATFGAGGEQDALVDHEAVIESLEEAERQNIGRIVYLSPVRIDESEASKETGAKEKPEEWIENSRFDYTVIRTVKAVSKPGKVTIEAAEKVKPDSDEMPYEDMAGTIVETLENENTFRKTFEMTAGDTPIKEALDAL
ncbi:NAD(P)H-binding protein [Salinicoccus kekensis]|uniref:Uncharacterized protein YbjT n=1 Tax=Salinicoccus kekensis TaxID=714307 RepID=A0A285UN03_9STAP|nr:NAD(P)H-binding protein [Salinicoccus kekensis]SOC41611.1 uncharacterized protein YbjT [Salinicoccus kekensis]